MFQLVIFILDDGSEKVVASVLNPRRAAHVVAFQNGAVVHEGTDLVALNTMCDSLNGLIAQLRAHYPTFFGRELAVEMGVRFHKKRTSTQRYSHLGYAEAQVPAEA